MSQAQTGPAINPEEIVPNGTPANAEAQAQTTPETPEQEYKARMSPDDLRKAISERAATMSADGKSQEEITEALQTEFGQQMPEPSPEEAAMVEAMQSGGEAKYDADKLIEAASRPDTPSIGGITEEELEARAPEAEKQRRDQLPALDRMVENYTGFYHDAYGQISPTMQFVEQWIDRPMYGGFIPRDPVNSLSYALSAARGAGKMLLSVNNMILGAAGYELDELPNPDTAFGTSQNNWGPGFVEGGTQWGLTALAVASGAYVLAPGATAAAPGFTGVFSGTVGDMAAFDPRQPSLVSLAREFTGPELQEYMMNKGGLFAFAAPFVGEEANDFLKLFDPKYIAETGGGQAVARSALALEGFFAAMTIGGFFKAIGGSVRGFDAIGRGFDSSTPKASATPIPGVTQDQFQKLMMEMPPEIRDLPMDSEAGKRFARYVSEVVARGARAEQLYAEGLSNREVISRLDDEFGGTVQQLKDEHWLEGQAIMFYQAMRNTDNPVTMRQARIAVNGFAKAGQDVTNNFFVSPALTKEADEAIGRQAMAPTREERLQEVYEQDYARRAKPVEDRLADARNDILIERNELLQQELGGYPGNRMPDEDSQAWLAETNRQVAEAQEAVLKETPMPERVSSTEEAIQRGAELEYYKARDEAMDEVRVQRYEDKITESAGYPGNKIPEADEQAYNDETDRLVFEAKKKFEAENVNPRDYGSSDALVLNPRPWVQEKLTPAEKRFWEEEAAGGLAQEMREAGIYYKDGKLEVHDAGLADDYLSDLLALPPQDRPKLPPSFYREDFLDKFKDPDGNLMGTSRPGQVQGPLRPPGDRRLFQTDAEGNVKGSVRIDEYDEAAFITLYKTADIDTVNEEMAHVLRGQLLGPRAKHLAKGNKGTLKLDEIEKVEEHYGVVDGKWTEDQEEAFARDMRAFILDNQDSPELSKEFSWMAAHLRTVLDDAKNGGLSQELTDASVNLWAILKNKRNLPIRYGDNPNLPAQDWSALTARIAELEEQDIPWQSVIDHNDLLANAGLRQTLDGKGDLQKIVALSDDLAREMREKNVLGRPKSDTQLKDSAYQLYADVTGQDVDEAIAMLSSTNHVAQDMDDQVVAGNIILVGVLEDLMESVKRADRSQKVTDLAIVQMKYMKFQELSNVVARLKTQTGRALRAYRWPGHVLPTEKALQNEEVALEYLRQARGERRFGDPGTLAGQELLDNLRGLTVVDDARLIAETVRDANRQWGSRATGVFHEFYVNGLLASGTTWAGVSTVSPLAIMFSEGGAKLLYSGLMATVSREQRAVFKETLNNIGLYLSNLKTSANYATKAFMKEEGVMMGPSARLDDAEFVRQATKINYEGDNFILQGLAGLSNLLTRNVVRLPSRAITSVDEFFRQLVGRTAAMNEVTAINLKRMLDNAQGRGELPFEDANGKPIDVYHSEFQKWMKEDTQAKALNKAVKRDYERTIKDGRLRNRTALLEEARQDPAVIAMQEENRVRAGFMMNEYIDREARKQPADVVKKVEEKSKDVVLQAELGEFGQKIQGVLDASPMGSFRVVIPFYRTPVNSFKRAAVYLSPASAAGEAAIRLHRTFTGKGFTLPQDSQIKWFYKSHLEDLASKDPRRVAEARAKQLVGTGMMLTALELVSNDRLSGAGPEDPELRKAWMATGWRPYSIKIGNTWYSYRKMDPAGTMLGVIADFHEMSIDNSAYGEIREAESVHVAILCSLLMSFKDKSMLQGMDQILEVGSNPRSDKAKTTMRRLMVSATPGVNVLGALQRKVIQLINPEIREARNLVDQYRENTLLGDATKVPPRYDTLGREVTRNVAETPIAMRVANLFTPFEMSPETADPASIAMAAWKIPQTAPREEQYNVDLTTLPGIDGQWTAHESHQMLIGSSAGDRVIRLEYSDPTTPGARPKMYTLEELVVAHWNGEFKDEGRRMAESMSKSDPEVTQIQEFMSAQLTRYRKESLKRLTGYADRPGSRVRGLISEVEMAMVASELQEARVQLKFDEDRRAPSGAIQQQRRFIKGLVDRESELQQLIEQSSMGGN